MLEKIKCKSNCATCREIPNENIYYEGHMIKCLDSKYIIDRLPIKIVLLGYLENVGWVVLNCDYTITPKSNIENYLYDLNYCSQKRKDKSWHNLGGTNRQILYGVGDHLHERRFVSNTGSHNAMLNMFQNDCDVINQYLNIIYNFDILENVFICFSSKLDKE